MGRRGREAGGQDRADPRVEGADVERLEAAAARARDREAVPVHVVPRQQVVDGAHAVPHHVPHEARPGDRREVAEDRVLAADEVVAAAPARLVPELAALALADGVPAEDDVPAAREAGRDLLVGGVGLADRRVAAREEHRGLAPRGGVGQVHEGGHVDSRQALEDELVDPIAVHRDRPRDAGVERRLRFRQPADHGEDLPPQLVLQDPQVGLGRDPREALLPRRVEGPRALELVREERRDARAFGLRIENPQHLGRGDLGGADRRRARDGHGESKADPDRACHPEELRSSRVRRRSPEPGSLPVSDGDPQPRRIPRNSSNRSPHSE